MTQVRLFDISCVIETTQCKIFKHDLYVDVDDKTQDVRAAGENEDEDAAAAEEGLANAGAGAWI